MSMESAVGAVRTDAKGLSVSPVSLSIVSSDFEVSDVIRCLSKIANSPLRIGFWHNYNSFCTKIPHFLRFLYDFQA